MLHETSNRRTFLKNIVLTAPFLAAAHRALSSKLAFAGAQWVSEDAGVAKALGYVHDGSKVPNRPKRGDTAGSDQTCRNCQLYKAGPNLDGKEAGTCLMLPGGLVRGDGWCKSWVKKA